MRERIPTAMVGGSFDPVHLGHLYLVHAVVNATDIRRFIFVPLKRNHFKPEAVPASEHHRLAMLRLAIDAYPSHYPDDPPIEFIIDPCELERTGISYTYDTVIHLYETYSIADRLAVVIGDDLLADLVRWNSYEKLKALVRFIAIRREKEAQPIADPDLDLLYLENVLQGDSSTTVRKALNALGSTEEIPASIRSLVPAEVAAYLDTHQLYRL